MKKLIAIILALLATFLASCANHFQVNPLQRAALDSRASAIVTVPGDPRFEDDSYQGAGLQTAQAVATAFSRHLSRVDISSHGSSGRGFDYVVTPTIVHWEDRATQWSGLLDRIEIQVRVMSAPNGNTVSLGSVKASSHWATFVNRPPDQLLSAAMNKYVDSLFAAPQSAAR